MAKAKKTEKNSFKGMKLADLNKQLATLQENARVIRFKAEGAKPKNVKEIANLKKDIARILTEIKAQSAK